MVCVKSKSTQTSPERDRGGRFPKRQTQCSFTALAFDLHENIIATQLLELLATSASWQQ